jgi:hypothetical protein
MALLFSSAQSIRLSRMLLQSTRFSPLQAISSRQFSSSAQTAQSEESKELELRTGDSALTRKQKRKEQAYRLKEMDQLEKESLIHQHFPKVKNGTYPKVMYDVPLSDLQEIRKIIIRRYGFTQEEINSVLKYHPALLVNHMTHLQKVQSEDELKGLKSLEKVFCREYNQSREFVRKLVIRYPFVLGKTRAELRGTLESIIELGLSEKETIDMVQQCPQLFSTKVSRRVEETVFLFDLYHQMSRDQVIEIFRNFPFLMQVASVNLKRFLGQFKKYRYSHEQIMNLVSRNAPY